HSDAVRRVEGVRAGVQYTLPSEQAMARVRAGDRPALATRDKHKRECYVVLVEGAAAQAVAHAIVYMPHQFVDYDTTVHVVPEQELAANHAAIPHGGVVTHGGNTASGTDQTMEFALKLGSNPEFTASVLVAYARAACKLNRQGRSGAFTILGVPPGLLSPKSAAQWRGELIRSTAAGRSSSRLLRHGMSVGACRKAGPAIAWSCRCPACCAVGMRTV